MAPSTAFLVPGGEVCVAGRPGGPLAGLTFVAKDLFDVAGHPTGAGNHDWARTRPSRRRMPGRSKPCSTPAEPS